MVGGRKLLGALLAVLIVPATATANTIVPDTFADEPGADPDNGNCTLREAIESADHDVSEDACRRGSGADLIKLRRGTYQLSVPGSEPVGSTEIDNAIGDLDIGLFGTSPVKILGHKRGTTVDGDDHDRVFQVFNAGTVTFQRLTITDGAAINRGGGVNVFTDSRARLKHTTIAENTAGDGDGGVSVFPGAKATFAQSTVRDNAVPFGKVGGGLGVFGRVVLNGSKVTGNDAHSGGGIWVYADIAPDPAGVATLRRTLVAKNDSALSGGGIGSSRGSRLTLSESTIERNDAGGSGGGISIDRGTLIVKASTITGNDSFQNGGGIALSSDPSDPVTMRIENTTVSGNVADKDGGGGSNSEGGGISAASFGEKRIVSSTITANRANRGGGIAGPFVSTNLPVELRGTIVARNTALNPGPVNGPDCLLSGTGSGMSLGHNLIGDPNGCDMGAVGSDLGGNAGLKPLQSNGGPTKTHALKPGSQAVDAGPNDAPSKDQRGVRRHNPDIGSYERS
ncbi:MAG: hypothetical protein QOI31_1241 [Solirubrobacterales bacterium]|jgi:CSLREA domain-containing protein|nr:hypothetical protein [Solirubrobacterales bacterium]